MEEFLLYEGKVAVAIAVFYMFYRLLLSRDTLHLFNRAVLLSTAVLSFVLPFCVITVHRTVEVTADTGVMASDILLADVSGSPAVDWWATAILILYITGVAAVLARMAVSMASAIMIIRKGCLVHEGDGIRIIVTDRNITPFSYMKYIVMPEGDWAGDSAGIIVHETAHIRRRHSADVILVEVMAAFQWFNPAIWMLRADLRTLHEYEADDAVLRSGADINEYQYLLIRKAVGASGYSVTNSFNHSTLKNRITMMSRKKSSLWSAWKALYIVPLVGLSLAATARTVTDYSRPEKAVAVESDKSNEKSADSIATDGNKLRASNVLEEVMVVKYEKEEQKNDKEVKLSELEEKPLFEGQGMEAFSKYVNMNLVYPKVVDGKKSGAVTVAFTVGSDGKVKNVHVLRGVSQALDEEAVRVVSSSPLWTPGKIDGKAVDVNFVIPIVFKVK